MISRERLRAHLWDAGTHVDYDRGLAYCLGQVRTALGDTADNPRFVETLPRRGYRFIASIGWPALPWTSWSSGLRRWVHNASVSSATPRRSARPPICPTFQNIAADRLAEAVRRHVIERDPDAPRFTR